MRQNVANSAASVRQVCGKCAASVRQSAVIFFNYVGFLCWKAAQILLHEVRLIILSIRTNE